MSFEAREHSHHFGGDRSNSESKTRWVVVLTFVMMVIELVVGYSTNSMALTADGWHMSTHVAALGMAAFAYWFARKNADSASFTFGTGKIHALAGYTSALILAVVAVAMIVESGRRMLHPMAIAFSEALPVAVIGLLTNLASLKLLHGGEHENGHGHGHGHGHGQTEQHAHEQHEVAHSEPAGPDQHHAHDERDPEHEHHGHGHAHEEPKHEHHGHDHGDHAHGHGHAHAEQSAHGPDHNMRAAYMHVLADALTSVLAIVALVGGRYAGWTFLDSLMGVVGGLVILQWSFGLCRGAARQLLDVVPSAHLVKELRSRIEQEFSDTRVTDLHLWEVAPGATACILSLTTSSPRPVHVYQRALETVTRIDHLTVEVNAQPGAH